MSCKRPTEIQVEGKMFQVYVGFEFFQPDGRLDVDKKEPQEYCWYTKALF